LIAQAGDVSVAPSALAARGPAEAPAAAAAGEGDPARGVAAASWVVSPAIRPPTGTRPKRSQPCLNNNLVFL